MDNIICCLVKHKHAHVSVTWKSSAATIAPPGSVAVYNLRYPARMPSRGHRNIGWLGQLELVGRDRFFLAPLHYEHT